ncbi:RHS repeat-associated core domain-containing protein [Apibacter adventoris]|uniref:RHS repeat-associated core domain-containing protein n=1 Tax=Apibacter adventoris TaxID=1679466 RepID=UPI001C87EAB9|nr:RHS repeat-associated core domain-containing protein [Apibacter adventoris]
MESSSYITNLDAQIVQHVAYVPFGEVLIEERNQSWNTPYLFNGKELDEETGLYYYGARYYNPWESVWLSTDPLSGYNPIMETEYYIDGQHNKGVFNSFNLNTYGYCYQNPVLLVDPNGKQAIVESVKGGVTNVTWKVKVNNYEGSADQLALKLNEVSKILSQNKGLNINIVQDNNAIYTLEFGSNITSKQTATGVEYVMGSTQIGNMINGTAYVQDDSFVIAHEMGHSGGLGHIFDVQLNEEGKVIVNDTPNNKYNLMNTEAGDGRTNGYYGGKELNQDQINYMKNYIESKQEK